MVVERFAPSPTGYLHLGHGFSALTAYDAAIAQEGRFLLRIEDIDTARSKPEYEDAIYEDLRWLGIKWEEPVLRQSERMDHYNAALERLTDMGLCYPCSCTRRDIIEALSAPQEGSEQQFGPDGAIYPRTCCTRSMAQKSDTDAVRLDMRKAVAALGVLSGTGYTELGENVGWKSLSSDYLVERCGDIVLARRDIGTSYHLAVVVDDAAQAVTHVTRGADMAPATPIHVLLQNLLSLPTPNYRHHRLIRDDTGKRLAKRHDALALRTLRGSGWTPDDVREAVKP
ncbi:tRNA glutamyl-Q(34) synthetase GluQRS [Neptunicoccus cionae]|uniref:tRNA glutamyl-Q(34) synthetase GluQRS n=1 Tax=Neptunicoccus cionae TaxID=2035344 RepID=UPI000C775EC0|nr:tRNA glutamyl-Q(34) synthetase GluQRS [Amylibacter cionae]PLS20723.1 tRNA glutamyl-Q(34) synthetase GluQRS [Amylibacter cionae]